MSEIIGRSIYSGLAAWLPGASEEAGPAFFGTAPSEREVDLYRREWLGEWMRDAAVFGTAAARVTDGRIERVDPSTIPHVESEAEVSQHPTDQTEESADGEE